MPCRENSDPMAGGTEGVRLSRPSAPTSPDITPAEPRSGARGGDLPPAAVQVLKRLHIPVSVIDNAAFGAEGAEASTSELTGSCQALASAYRTWIEEREQELAADASLGSEPELKARGLEHLADCRECHARIEVGIVLLDSDADAAEAFQLMNTAMLEQRAHYALASEDANRRSWRKGANGQEPSAPCPTPDYSYDTRWRPFQLAFILMNIRSFADPAHPERALVDVIWFPTGGGKTEAYLGLAAFVILLRRLRNPHDAGTTVLMRYTLRLLTTQQFQRAASLICALEKRRRAKPGRFGSVPVSIGLWLGSGVTPNSDADAVERLGKLAWPASRSVARIAAASGHSPGRSISTPCRGSA
jgi:hypothetical protein